MKTKELWVASDISSAEYFGTMEIEDKNGEFHYFKIMLIRGDRYIFGGACNAGFLESGYMKLENEGGELQELHNELITFYDDGPEFTNRIVFNDRM